MNKAKIKGIIKFLPYDNMIMEARNEMSKYAILEMDIIRIRMSTNVRIRCFNIIN